MPIAPSAPPATPPGAETRAKVTAMLTEGASMPGAVALQSGSADAKGAKTSIDALLIKYPDSAAAIAAKKRLKK